MSNKSRALDVTIRYASPDDAAPVAALAAVDSQPVPEGELLVAEVDGELWAAVSVTGQGTIADPFRPTADVRTLLEARARQLRGQERRGSRFEPAAWLRAALPGR